MSWDYRVVRTTLDGDTRWAIHEVFYKRDGSVGWTETPNGPEIWQSELSENEDPIAELLDILHCQLASLSKPVIEE